MEMYGFTKAMINTLYLMDAVVWVWCYKSPYVVIKEGNIYVTTNDELH